jgi:uncharacterized protein involved in type VI secretion and phage assembly
MISRSRQKPESTESDHDHRYYGKFRATVVDNFDPKGEMRLKVQVPDVSGDPLLSWATCCTPIGGPQHGLFSVPPNGTGIFVEFEQGDIDFPIWTGCFWGNQGEAPERSKSVHRKGNQSITLQTPSKHSITISERASEGIELKTPQNARIQLIDRKIIIDNGAGASIILEGPEIKIKAAKVTINEGALVIT